MLQFSREKNAPLGLNSKGTAKYDEFFDFFKKNAVAGEWIKAELEEPSKEVLDRAIHSMSSSIRGWKDRLNKSGEFSIKITQSRKYISDTKAQIWIFVEEFTDRQK